MSVIQGLRRWFALFFTAVLAVCLLYVGVWGFDIRGRRPWKGSTAHLVGSYTDAVRFYPMAATALFSGFRGLAADLLWLRADAYWHHGQWQRLLPIYELITLVQPRFMLVWSIASWHMAYNLSEFARRNPEYSPEQKTKEARRWMDEGVLFLKRGLKYNEDKPDLYFDLGWTYFDKMKDASAAIPYLEKAARMSDSIPMWKTLAHAYERDGRYAEALKVWESVGARGDSVAKKFIARMKEKLAMGSH